MPADPHAGDAKRARLVALRQGPHVTQSALQAVLRSAQHEGIPVAATKRSQLRAREQQSTRDTPYGKLVVPLDLPLADSPLTVAIQNPLAMLHTCCLEAKTFATLMGDTLSRQPSSPDHPWTIVLYCDEIGVKPLGDDTRKTETIYWSFLEFGPRILGMEDAWFALVSIRSTEVRKLAGGMSHVFSLVLPYFTGADIGDLTTAGMALQFFGSTAPTVMFFAAVGTLIADEVALKSVLCAKGASGMKPCWRCMNLVAVDAPLLEHSAYLHDIATLERAQHRQHSTASLLALLRDLAEIARADAPRLSQMETLWGWNHEPHSAVLAGLIKPVEMVMFDWMHVYLVGGLFNYELWNLLIFLKAAGVQLELLCEFVQKFTWLQKNVGDSAKRLFQIEALTKWLADADHFKGSASECLCIYPVIRVFLEGVVPGVCGKQAESYLALCNVLDTLVSLKHGVVDGALLDAVIVHHLACYLQAYGKVGWKPKHHMATHLAEQLWRHGFLLSCFVHERRHRLVKRHLRGRHNLNSFETGLVEELTLHHLHQLNEASFSDTYLEQEVKPKPAMDTALRAVFSHAQQITCSRAAVVRGGHITAGDVALAYDGSSRVVGQVWFHASIDGVAMTCLSTWDMVPTPKDSRMCATYRKLDRPRFMELNTLATSLTYAENSTGGCVTILWPPAIR